MPVVFRSGVISGTESRGFILLLHVCPISREVSWRDICQIVTVCRLIRVFTEFCVTAVKYETQNYFEYCTLRWNYINTLIFSQVLSYILLVKLVDKFCAIKMGIIEFI